MVVQTLHIANFLLDCKVLPQGYATFGGGDQRVEAMESRKANRESRESWYENTKNKTRIWGDTARLLRNREVVNIQIKEGKKKQNSKKYARERVYIILNNICYVMGFDDQERGKSGSSSFSRKQ